jgi:multidrug efflux pump subunit AcrA (membrane-fusion protein)
MTNRFGSTPTVAVVVTALVGLTGAAVWNRSGRAEARPDRAVTPANGTAVSSSQVDGRRRQLIGVRTVAATRDTLGATTKAVGALAYDESRIWDINLKVDGWLRDLFVSYVGQQVKAGQPLFTVFSPELDALQTNLIGAIRTREQTPAPGPSSDNLQYADRLIDAPRQRLKQFDVADEELGALEKTRQVPPAVTLRSPTDGIVIEKHVIKGMHVDAGQTLYRIADLSTLLLEAEFSETDVQQVALGSRAQIAIDAFPGEAFSGTILSVYPFLAAETRTLRARIEVRNPTGRLKPGMYASVELESRQESGILVPADAVVDTGRKQIVFVSAQDGYFEPRPVTVGARANGRVLVLDGLREHELVAERGTFFLDSESQIRAALQDIGPSEQVPSSERKESAATLTLLTDRDQARAGRSTFEVKATDGSGVPVTDARIALRLSMPAMPSMNMPAMATDAELEHVGRGIYRGEATISMAGRWDVTITARRGEQLLGTTRSSLLAR